MDRNDYNGYNNTSFQVFLCNKVMTSVGIPFSFVAFAAAVWLVFFPVGYLVFLGAIMGRLSSFIDDK